MRVVVAHNFYSRVNPSGENAVVEDDVSLLRAGGVDVVEYFRASDDIVGPRAKVDAAVTVLWNPLADKTWRLFLERHQPDVVHLHNPTPLLSPRSMDIATRMGVPVVRTIHNYRLTCIAGTHFRNGAICVACNHKTSAAGIYHGCYRGSHLQSGLITAGRAIVDTYRGASRLIALTEYMAEYLVSQGVHRDRIVVRANPVAVVDTPVKARDGFIFAGRFDAAKGVVDLVRDWQPERELLTVVGTGPALGTLRCLSNGKHNVVIIDGLPHEDLLARIRSARAVLVPSRWFEGFPRVIAESFSMGTPVIASRIGSLQSVVTSQRGWLVARWGPDELNRVLEEVHDPRSWQPRSDACLNYARSTLSLSVGFDALMAIYGEVVRSAPD